MRDPSLFGRKANVPASLPASQRGLSTRGQRMARKARTAMPRAQVVIHRFWSIISNRSVNV